MMRYLVRLLALAAALALAWFGTGTPAEDDWRIFLAGIALLLLIAFWPQRRSTEESASGHNVRLLGGLLLTVAVLLGLQLLRLQVSYAAIIRTQVAPLGEQDPQNYIRNRRLLTAEMRTLRGHIYDRDGVLLADTTVTPHGWAKRSYTRADLGYIVGFYNSRYGNYGLEATYDDYLAGRVNADPWAAFIEELLHRSHVGDDLHLTLDVGLQEVAEKAYQQVTQEVLGEDCPQGQCPGSVVLLDARTGAILAMVSHPRFDPRPLVFDPEADDWDAEEARISAYWEGLRTSPENLLVHRAASGLYPPGSTFKTLTAAVALETGLVTPETVISCPNHYTVTGHIIVNAVENLAQRMKKQNVLEDFQWSCNTAFAQIGLMIGAERYSEYGRKFGLVYQDTPEQVPDLSDLPSAVCTIAHDRSFIDLPTAMADTGYGQGELQVTPLYMAMLAQTIANDGVTMRPYLVEQAVGPAGRVLYQAQPTPLRMPISAPTARTMRMLMVNAVENGYGWRAKIEGVVVGGKTGTAEVPGGNPHGWFIALAPADNPRFAIAIIVEHGGHGLLVAAPIARIVLEAALQQP